MKRALGVELQWGELGRAADAIKGAAEQQVGLCRACLGLPLKGLSRWALL